MGTLSTFQSLPLYIAEAIAYYSISTFLLRTLSDPDKCKDTKAAWTKLHDVSYLWRVLALKYFFKELTITAMVDNGTGRLEYNNLPDEIRGDTAHHNYVKQVNIRFTDLDDSPVESFQDLSKVWPKALVLPSARSLKIDPTILYFQQFDEHGASANQWSYWIMLNIRTLLPNLQGLIIGDRNRTNMYVEQPDSHRRATNDFLTTLFDKATAWATDPVQSYHISDCSLAQCNTGLAVLDYCCRNDDNLLGHLVEKAAPTLQLLKVKGYREECVKSLVISDKGDTIVYPRLQKLEFIGHYAYNLVGVCQSDESVAPFPALRYLHWSSRYIFADDTLFRGNSGSLEYLSIVLTDYSMDILQKYKVFVKGKYTQLSHISLIDNKHHSEELSLSPDLFLAFAIGLFAPNIQSVLFQSKIAFTDMVGSFTSNPYSTNIQTLNLIGTWMTLLELLELVNLLPNMKRLVLDDLATNDGEPSSTLDRSSVNAVYTRYYPLSCRFKHLEVDVDSSDDIYQAAVAAIILAILCPNFVTALVSPDCRDELEFEGDIKKVLESRAYDDHDDRIQVFLQSAFQHV